MKITSWRIIQAKHANEAFSGEGAQIYGGRWNHKGHRMIYTAASLSLAAMEMLIHIETPQILDTFVCIPVEFEDGLCKKLDASNLLNDWMSDILNSLQKGLLIIENGGGCFGRDSNHTSKRASRSAHVS